MNDVKKRKRAKVGDIFEIKTCKGLAYCQYVLKNAKWGELIRIFPGFFNERPDSFKNLVDGQDQFMTFCMIGIYCSRGVFDLVANEDIPEKYTKLPLFKASGARDTDGRIQNWWLWDGENSWMVGPTLDKEQRILPTEERVDDVALIYMIENEHTNETEYVNFAAYYDPKAD